MSENKYAKNLAFWKEVETSDPDTVKNIELGRRKFSSIDAFSQVKRATEVWGMMGKAWGVENERFQMLTDKLLLYQALLWYKDGDEAHEIPIASSIAIIPYSKLDDECVKKVRTDALTKGLSLLGFNADVFENKFADNRYVNALKEDKAKKTKGEQADELAKLKPELIKTLSETKDLKQVTTIWTGNPGLKEDKDFIKAVKEAGERLKPKDEAKVEPDTKETKDKAGKDAKSDF